MRFVKMQGTGNDFLLVEARDESRDWEALARAMCERHYGVGADGLILVLPSERGDVRMRLFNADGSEAEVSGNGVRCLVKYVVERGLARPPDGRVRVEAASGLLEAEVFGDRRVERVRLSMGAPRFEPEEVPVIVSGDSCADSANLEARMGELGRQEEQVKAEIEAIQTGKVDILEGMLQSGKLPESVAGVFRKSAEGGRGKELWELDVDQLRDSGHAYQRELAYALEKGILKHRTVVAYGQAALARKVRELEEIEREMEEIQFARSSKELSQGPLIDMPLDIDGERLRVTCLSMGNPHAVLFIDGPVEEYPLEDLGPKVERHPAFPARVNFGVARISGAGRMDLRVWERGVGETLACGSGSSAATVAARLKGLAGERVDITQPGGPLTVEWDGRGEVYLSGPAEFVFEGEWPD